MTLLLAVIVVSIATGYAVGGRLGRFEQLRLRWWGLAPIGLAMQLAPLPDLQGDGERLLGVGLLIGSYALLLAFVAANARVAGFPLLFVGLALNLAVIAANGGMPVSRPALEASGQTRSLHLLEEGEGGKHHLLGKGDVLTALADVIAVGRPIGQVVSVGDVVAYGGVIWLVVAVMRGRTR
ncbi:MAG: DUF5317 domain-containing protein, partial [Actinobacteria bacterium]|nr:DUF5317 domain-containing protein [Actinomycetota bacterium]